MLEKINRSAFFWVGIIVLCLAMEAGALYYQYVLDYLPCVLCVHVRAWVLFILLAAILGLFLRRGRLGLMVANLLVFVGALGMLERSYVTLGTEMGWIDGSCSELQASFPTWLPLDHWFPALFKALESCGLTPWLIPQWLSMAQGLVGIAVLLSTVMLVLLMASLFWKRD